MDYLEYHSQSFSTSSKKQSILLTIKGIHYFVEFPTNLFPDPKNIKHKRNDITILNEDQMNIMKEGFIKFEKAIKPYPYLRLPDFLNGFCISKGLDLDTLDLLK